MKKFNVDLLEDNYACYFSIDWQDKKEFSVRKKTGILSRCCTNNKWSGSSHELSSLHDASKFIDRNISLKGLKKHNSELPVQPGHFIKSNRLILDFLHNLNAAEWKIISRSNLSKRIIIDKKGKEKKSDFNYFNILIKIRLKDHRHFIEVGEGSGRNSKFNQDGLISRLKDIIANQSEKKSIRFPNKIPVVLNAGDGAILFHEILGHALEADYIYQNLSPIKLTDIGERIISKNVSISTSDKNDSFFSGIQCDDEGESPKSPFLVEKGVLKNIICDSFYKNLLGVKSAGHSRTEDFTRLPMPRAFSLYLKPDKYHPEELVASTKYGVFAREFGEGKINFDKNLFYFHIRDAMLIENGKRSAPLGNIVVSGDIVEVLNSIDMIADDFRYDKGIGYCFKKGQALNVRVGQPTVKINNLCVTKGIDD
ncbi:MAG: TldD/PmbA family protein [bacterium]|nr:TldD/PmbA family protein [bacterium]